MSPSVLNIAAPELNEVQATEVNAALMTLQAAKKSLHNVNGSLGKNRVELVALEADLAAVKAKVRAYSTNPADHTQYSALLSAYGAAERGVDKASNLLTEPTIALCSVINATNYLLGETCGDAIVQSIKTALRTAMAPFYAATPRGLMSTDAQIAFGCFLNPQISENLPAAALLTIAASRIELLTKLAAHAPDFFTFQGYDPAENN